MAKTDRAFRALARAAPRTVLSLLRLVLPGLLRVGDEQIVALDDPQLDLPPHPRQADFAATVGDDELLHVEAQGYRDRDFLTRKFDYHVILALRHPTRVVRTCAIWLRPPRPDQRVGTIDRGSVTVRVETIVLREVPSALLLTAPETACFAVGADAGERDEDTLCDEVVRALGRPGAHPFERAMAAVAAGSTGRYPSLVRAMERADMEPVIIEDLVDYGYDLGLAEGHAEGHAEGRLGEARAAVLTVLGARGFTVDDALAARVNACDDLTALEAWLRRAVVAPTVDDTFA
jgi:hypothetical protein